MTFPVAERSVKPDWRRTAVEVCSALGLTLLVWLYGGKASVDDLFIYLRYADNLRRGQGLVYNVGEASAGVTSLAWLLLASTVSYLFGNIEIVWKLLGLALVCAALLLMMRALRFLPWASALVLAALTLLDPFAIRWAATGMDGALVYLATILFFILFQAFVKRPTTRTAVLLGAVSVVMPFVRPELAIVSALASVFVAIAYWRVVVVEAVVFAGLLMASWRWTGFLLPQTGEAKALLLVHPDRFYAVPAFLTIAALAIPGAALAIAATWRLNRRLLPLVATAVVLFGSLLAYFAITNTLVSTRYSVVYSGPLLCCAALALAQAHARLGRWTKVMVAAVAVQGVACVAVLVWMFPATRTDEAAQIREIGIWAREHLPPHSVVALRDIGAFGYFYGGPIVDLVGLVSPPVVDYARGHGVVLDPVELSPLLTQMGVTHFLDTRPGSRPLDEASLFTPLQQWPVIRNNLSDGRERAPDIWRLYNFHPLN
jgi:hypothetical protein